MDFKSNASCDGFPTDSSSSSKSLTNVICGKSEKKEEEKPEEELVCPDAITPTSTSSTSVSIAFFDNECRLGMRDDKKPPNIAYEVAVAKSIMQQYSTISGDNLFDHISDIIKRVIDERPPNIIDFFEEFSRNVREQKFHLPERFPPESIFEETRLYRVAKRQLLSMKLPFPEEHHDDIGEDMPMEEESMNAEDLKLDLGGNIHLFKTFDERVQQLQFYWNQCGFSISTDDIFQLACAMTRLQAHPSIMQCRFWGMINGLKASYYIVEASLSNAEVHARYEQMQIEIREKKSSLEDPLNPTPPQPPPNIGNELLPGINGWENWPAEELVTMQPPAAPVPLIKVIEVFDIPPEPVGSGLNRYSYFVVNSLSDEWIELPIVTPKQIVLSRKIKKFMTGDLESEINSIPCFPGVEKHYLRAMIARITAGTYIAPRNYYRKMTKREKRLYEGLDDDEMEEEEEEEDLMGEDEEGDEIDNDIILLKNEKYEPLPLISMGPPYNWLHVRPNILIQGRVVWFDEEKARREREKELQRLLKLQMGEEEEEEEEDIEDEGEMEGEGEEELDTLDRREIGPSILTPCNEDASAEYTVPWVSRLTSNYTNKQERVLVMRSNTWPGAYTFTFDKICESIYMGWGHKYVSRNMAFNHLAPVVDEYPHNAEDFIEANDPTVAEEEAYRLALLKRNQRFAYDGENLGEFDDDEEDTDEVD